jgi:hypothetical protein
MITRCLASLMVVGLSGCGGEYTDERLTEMSQVSADTLASCLRDQRFDEGASQYDERCSGKTGVYYGIVNYVSATKNGAKASLEMGSQCGGDLPVFVNAEVDDKEVWENLSGRCVGVIAKVSETLSVSIVDTFWLESDEDLALRIDAIAKEEEARELAWKEEDQKTLSAIKTIYSLNGLDDADLPNLTCSNAKEFLRNNVNQISINWVVRDGEQWQQWQGTTRYCNEDNTFKTMGMCLPDSPTVGSYAVASPALGEIETTSTIAEHPSCLYKTRTRLRLEDPGLAEIWSEGQCRYPQPRKEVRYLLCS